MIASIAKKLLDYWIDVSKSEPYVHEPGQDISQNFESWSKKSWRNSMLMGVGF